MAQTQQPASNNPSLGAQAAAAAAGSNAAKPTTTPTTTPAATGAKPEAAADADAGAAADVKNNTNPNKLFIVTGQVHQFDTYAQAEKFLNADGAPTQYTVLRGKAMKAKQKTSLR